MDENPPIRTVARSVNVMLFFMEFFMDIFMDIFMDLVYPITEASQV
jgi:hypothetical protein